MENSKEKENVKYAGKTEEEWRDWGAAFGKRMDSVGKELGDELEDWGERFGDYMEQKGHRWERKWQRKWERKMQRRWRGRWFDAFGIIGPFFGTVVGMIFLLLGVLALDLINGTVHSAFISAVSGFVYGNLHIFFATSLFLAYGRYFSRTYPALRGIIRPLTGSVGITFTVWIAVFVLDLVNNYVKSASVQAVAVFLDQNLLGIFFAFLVLGYVFEIFFWLVFGAWDRFY